MLVPASAVGAHDYTASETFTVNGQDLGGHLILGLIGSSAAGDVGASDFTSLTLTVKVNGVTKVSDSFSSLAAAESFFANDAINLGTVPDAAGTQVQVSLDVNSATKGFGFAGEFVLGATDGSAPPTVTAPASLMVAKSEAIGGVSVAESNPLTGGETVTVVLQDHTGALSVTAGQGTIGGNATTHLTLTGTVAQVNADLATLAFADPTKVADVIQIQASDSRTGVAAPAQIDMIAPFYFTRGKDNLAGGAGNDLFIAADGTLNSCDTADGAGGTNTLLLQGGGYFDLGAPTKLANIQVVDAQEAQPSWNQHGSDGGHGPGDAWGDDQNHHGDAGGGDRWGHGGDGGGDGHGYTGQMVVLRDGMNTVTVNVAPAALDPHNPNPATITIIGANNNDVINLASGADTVVMGSAAETVNGGSGADTIIVDGSTIGATINGGTSGKSVLEVRGGGTVTMGGSVTNIAEVALDKSDHAWTFTANATAGLVVDDQSDKSDTLVAGAAGQTLEGGAGGKETFVGFGSGKTTYADDAKHLNGDTIDNFSDGDAIDVQGLAFDSKTQVSFKATSATSGILTISENGHIAAKVALFGQLAAATFTAQSDGAGGALILDPPTHKTTVAHTH